MIDLLLPLGGVGLDEVLVDRQADRRDAIVKGLAFEFLEISPVLRRQRLAFREVHLLVQDVQALDANLGGLVNDSLDGDLLGFEMPVRVGGNSQLYALLARGGSGFGFLLFSAQSDGRA